MTDKNRQEIRTIAAKKAGLWVEHGPHSDLREKVDSVGETVASTINDFEKYFIDGVHYFNPDYISREMERDGFLTSGEIITSDYVWIVENKGRPNRKIDAKSEFNDSFLSHLIYYGLLSNDTRNPAMNVIFKRVKTALLMRLAQPDTDFDSSLGFGSSKSVNHRMQEVFRVYVEHHPEEKAKIETELNRLGYGADPQSLIDSPE